MNNLLWNQLQSRPRTIWRLILQFGLLLALMIPFSFCALVVAIPMLLWQGVDLTGFMIDPGNTLLLNPLVSAPYTVATLLAFVGSLWLAARFVDRRPFADYGLHLNGRWWADFAFGLALGALLMALIFTLEWAAGWLEITAMWQTPWPGVPFAISLIPPLITFIAVGVYEELYFRGFWIKNLAEGFSFWSPRRAIAVSFLLSSAVFGLAHTSNPNATAVSTFNLMLAGLFLGVGYLLTGELAIPIGLHITWNFFQGHVFGFPVSGQASGLSVFVIRQGGDVLLAGGAFGPEAGLIGLAAMGLGSGLMVAWVWWRYGRIAMAPSLTHYTPNPKTE